MEQTSHADTAHNIHLHLMQATLHGTQTFECSGLLKFRCLCNFIDMKQLHKTLKEKREHEGYSQEYIAEKLNVSSSTISRWETGAISMSVVQIYNYAKALDMDEGDLLASIARRRQEIPLPFVRLNIDVFDEEIYGRMMDLVKELGPQHIILQTKL